VVVACPGFLTGGLETLEELGLRGRRAFLEAGGEDLRLADPPSGHPRFLAAALRGCGNPEPMTLP
jgi:ferrochelatase